MKHSLIILLLIASSFVDASESRVSDSLSIDIQDKSDLKVTEVKLSLDFDAMKKSCLSSGCYVYFYEVVPEKHFLDSFDKALSVAYYQQKIEVNDREFNFNCNREGCDLKPQSAPYATISSYHEALDFLSVTDVELSFYVIHK